MSSFVRRGPSGSNTDTGTRAGGYGQTLVSCGHLDLDRILGGGLPLGSLLLTFEDEWTSHHVTLAKLFLAEGAVCGHVEIFILKAKGLIMPVCTRSLLLQSLMLATAKEIPGGLEAFIPRHVHPPSNDSKVRCGDGSGSEKAADNEDEQTEPQLRIAWQYGRYLRKQQQQRGGSGSAGSDVSSSFGSKGASGRPLQRDWCHDFDLTKSAGPEGLTRCRVETRLFSGQEELSANLTAQTAMFTDSLKIAGGTHRIGRCVILSLGDVGWGLGVGSQDAGRCIVQSLIGVKLAIRESQCAALVTIPRALVSASDLARLTHIADVVLTLSSPSQSSDIVRLAPDAASICGLLQLIKANSLGTLVSPGLARTVDCTYFIRHKRRRISITPIEIDPDKEADSATALPGCVSGGGEADGSKLLDF